MKPGELERNLSRLVEVARTARDRLAMIERGLAELRHEMETLAAQRPEPRSQTAGLPASPGSPVSPGSPGASDEPEDDGRGARRSSPPAMEAHGAGRRETSPPSEADATRRAGSE